jgi:uncharacterized delta-60 repeat protein
MKVRAAVAAALVTLCAAPSAMAAEGDLDATFGSGGRVQTPVGADPRQSGMTFDAQGRIVVVGQVDVSPADADMLVVRYLPDGTPDPSFSSDGIATFDFPPADDFQEGNSVTVDAQGRILVFGVTEGVGGTDFALIRVNPDGTRDTTFGPLGSNGFVTKDLSGDIEFAGTVALDSQARIVLGGTARVGGDFDFGVVRYDANGVLDTSFSGDGQHNVDFTPVGSDQDFGSAMVIDSQGRIVLAGRTQQPTLHDFALARLNSDGSYDTTFGPGVAPSDQGRVTTPIGTSDDQASSLTIDPQGRIIAAGSADVASLRQFAVARYNPDGSLDTTFSGDGKQITEIEGLGDGESAHTVVVDSHGRIVLAGQSGEPGARNYALARYGPDGELDPTFGSGGKVTVPNGQVRSALLDAQDRIVAGGLFTPAGGGDNQFGLARFIGDAVAPSATIGSGPADGAFINDPTPTFEFSTDDPAAALVCGFDGASSGCASPFTPAGPLADGGHTFSVSATDQAGNSSAATRTFTVDTQPPDIDIAGKKKVKTDEKKAKGKLTIETSEPAELSCAVDKKAPKPCEEKFKTPKLKLGKHAVTVTATDPAGNSSDETKKIKVVRKP